MQVALKKSEQNWMDSFRNGEDAALSYFFKLYYKSLCYFARRLTQNITESEDIVAECFVKLWERREDFKNAGNIKAFLYISCRNACLNHLKQLKSKSVAQSAYLSQLEEGEETILLQIIETEVLTILNQEIEQLPDNYRRVFKLIYFNQLKTDEIAEQMGISVQSVRNYKTRAIELLKISMFKKGMSGAISLALLLFIDRA